ncbi:hypothetical protein RR48_08615 [Papilio machaon]|uniref:Uncharacterized protein n=1 Tax=Papilio machaon TaxID=76193 RepID=A0A194RJ14_PAPMA|nr:hypothetical protein RR48_08615 [Papilio machaon]
MVEFMERYVNNVFQMVNTPQGRVRRQELCQLLKMLLGKAGSDPDKSMEQWIKMMNKMIYMWPPLQEYSCPIISSKEREMASRTLTHWLINVMLML